MIEDAQKFFYDKRDEYNHIELSFNQVNLEKGILLLFLNRTTYNGLYRQNSKGKFNSPHGDYFNIPNKEKHINNIKGIILKSHKVLEGTKIMNCDFEDVFENIQLNENSLIYYDPPYLPTSLTGNFTEYSKGGFSYNDQKRLSQLFKRIDKDYGSKQILTNSNHQSILQLYPDYQVFKRQVKYTINPKIRKKLSTKQILIYN